MRPHVTADFGNTGAVVGAHRPEPVRHRDDLPEIERS